MSGTASGTRNPQPIARLKHDGAVFRANFDRIGNKVITGEDGTARIWPLGRTALFDQARERITRNLYRTEWSRYLPELPYEMLRPDLGDPLGT